MGLAGPDALVTLGISFLGYDIRADGFLMPDLSRVLSRDLGLDFPKSISFDLRAGKITRRI